MPCIGVMELARLRIVHAEETCRVALVGGIPEQMQIQVGDDFGGVDFFVVSSRAARSGSAEHRCAAPPARWPSAAPRKFPSR